jgi:hypothetical protein
MIYAKVVVCFGNDDIHLERYTSAQVEVESHTESGYEDALNEAVDLAVADLMTIGRLVNSPVAMATVGASAVPLPHEHEACSHEQG